MTRHQRFLLVHTAVHILAVVLSLWGPTIERMWQGQTHEQTALQHQVDELKAQLMAAQQGNLAGTNDVEHHALMSIHNTLQESYTSMTDVIEKALGGSPSA